MIPVPNDVRAAFLTASEATSWPERPVRRATLPSGEWEGRKIFTTACLFASLPTMKKKLPILLLFTLFFAGCSTTVTNLTPPQAPRNARNLYPFEVALDTNQRSIKDNTIKAFVVIGGDIYPMEPTPLLTNRWETLVPIPEDQNFVYYKYKFDYLYKSIPRPKQDSKLSPPYKLEIVGAK
jgi:hypothetical protein